MKLTDEQNFVVQHRGSPLRVIAGPGTGKTSCVAARISSLILVDRIKPSRILAVTFTRAAAGETRQKLEKQGIRSDQLPDVRTLHSKAVGLLRKHHSRLGLSQAIRPLSDLEGNLVMKDAVADLSSLKIKLAFKGNGTIKDYRKAYQSEQGGGGIPGWVSNRQEHMETYQQFSETYQKLQRFYKCVDWFRVVNLAVQLFESHRDILEQERGRTEHVLVDEYQDLNSKDQELVHYLVGNPPGFCIVGDEDQSIYETQRFADPNGLISCHESVPNMRTLPLTYCHRCPTEVLDKANKLISNNKRRLQGKAALRATDPNRKGTVATFRHRSKKAEVEWLASKVAELHERGFQYRDFLILFTEGKIAEDYISMLRAKGIPLDVKLKVAGPFDSECFLKVLATLRFMADQTDNLALRQCFDYWPNIGPETLRQVRHLAIESNESFWQTTSAVAVNTDAYRTISRRRAVSQFHNAMTTLLSINEFDKLLTAILVNLPNCSGDPGVQILKGYFDKQSGKETAMKLSELLDNFEQEREAGSFETIEEELPDKVRIMTMHSAKGLEAKVVFIPALEDDLVPGQAGNLEERRRLFYVSVTRAKNILLMSWASQRTGPEIHRQGGKMLGKKKSSFLVEMGE